MTDIVIPLIKNKDNLELRYCLRSIEKHLSGVGKIFIIGYKPDWLRNCEVIHWIDNPDSKMKEWNICSKLMGVTQSAEISDDFLFMNDDHFLLQDFDAGNFPIYHKGEIYETMKKNSGTYRAPCNHARKVLIANGLPTLDFDVHCPHLINKAKFMTTVPNVDWSVDYGYLIKSLYHNMAGILGEEIKDCKIRKSKVSEIKNRIDGRSFFSTSGAFPEIIEIFQYLYPTPSKYES